mmetsp:Transcript_16492/g.14865  ORF Transcript_16492/g.14865 Transcript_16492/m.14865 type:complete len:106 (+) Transcript_16492:53-370(+)
MFRTVVLLAVIATIAAFSPMRNVFVRKRELSMNISPLSRFLGVAAIGAALAGPMTPIPVLADGAVSRSTVYKARLGYGSKILDLAKAADKGDFAAFADKKNSKRI